MEIVPLHWDSDFFGLRIAKAIVSSEKDVVALSRQEEYLQDHYDLICIFSLPGLEIPFEKARLVDRKAVFSLSAPEHFEANPAITRWDSPIASDDLISLALVSGKYSRFKLDERFPVGSYERLYSHWVAQSVNKTIATDVFCYMMDGRPLGLVTLTVVTDGMPSDLWRWTGIISIMELGPRWSSTPFLLCMRTKGNA